ncbi:MAG: hypothetical protein M3112_06035 [Actinomycetia bacterium]|nr:hypothetical protein [Actinomycetes bacterium]
MNRVLISMAAFALLVAACSSSETQGVASLESTATTTVASSANEASASDEDTLLEFASCMRDNGAEDFEDPSIGADGVPEFNLRGGGSEADRDVMRAAFEACSEHLEGLAFGPGSVDVTELEDTLVDYAACMRDNGYDMPDPDLSKFGERGGEGGGIFGGGLDPDDPDFISAMEECEHIFENLPFVGGGPGSRGGGG